MTGKYRYEFSLNVWGFHNLVMQPSDFDLLNATNGFDQFKKDPLHLYMICSRRRITFDPDSFSLTRQEIRGNYRIQAGEYLEKLEFRVGNSEKDEVIAIECPYPHTFAHFKTAAGVHVIKAGLWAARTTPMHDKLTMEVLYVGQAYGVDGSRTAQDRLQNHETLLSIIADCSARQPDTDVWLILWNLNSRWFTMIDGRQKDYATSEKEDDERMEKLLKIKTPAELEINLAEAALIRYFRPAFNYQMKDKFPHRDHKTYREAYEWDVNSLIIEIDTEDLGFLLKSPAVPASWHHTAVFPFHSDEQRRQLFNWMNDWREK
jgi:hypothetical protein